MSLITNLITDKETISFDLTNEVKKPIKIAYANALRQIIISRPKIYYIDEHSSVFYDSYDANTILNDEFLKDRLKLIPIRSDLNIDYENIKVTCKKENTDENMISVYVKDFIFTNEKTNEIIDTNMICKYPDILFTKLRHNGKISFESRLRKSNQIHQGSGCSSVAGCVYTFKIDMKKVNEILKTLTEKEQSEFMTQEVERHYERNENGEPYVYQFSYESIGCYDCIDILKFSLHILIEKLNELKEEFNNENSEKITLIDEKEDDEIDFYYFNVENESDLVGNLLRSYMGLDENVFYAGYVIPHVLKKNVILKFKLNENNTLKNMLSTITKTLDYLIELTNECLDNVK